ncbi:MAG: zf-HC2 domain-containing protein [Bacteroidia bacterium]|nr:zf-HC2 domain-containing protein [Bacteroidia bacterium]
MKCEEVEATMIDYLDNTLDNRLRQEIEKHLETCERCLDELRDCQQVMQLISKDEMVKPDDSMRINFYHMLHSEIKKSEGRNAASFQTSSIPWYNSGRYRIAAGIALLIGGTFLGAFIHSELINSYPANELKQLHSEVTALKKAAMFTMLKEESSSDRIQAVNYADDLENPDENVIEVLIKTLNQDKNVNVRMAAAYALAKYADRRSVCDSLVKSLTVQNDPILQVTLINILVERKEKSAIKPIQQIITNKSTLKEVKEVAENGVRLLI